MLATRQQAIARLEDPSYSNQSLAMAVSYTHLRAHETVLDLVCRLLLEKKTRSRTHTPARYTLNDYVMPHHVIDM